jgi:hypothetical protein
MGFNTLFALKGSDLEKIRNDEDFGAKLAHCVKMAEYPPEYRKHAGSGLFLSDLERANNMNSGYDIQVGVARHADDRTYHVVTDGRFWTTDWRGKTSWSAYTCLAETLAQFGYSVKMPSEGFEVEGCKAATADHEAIWTRMNGYDEPTFEDALITFTLLNDGLDSIEHDKQLGENMARIVRDWWSLSGVGRDLLRTGKLNDTYWRVENTISSRNHCNPISIIGATPAGHKDVVCISQNWGRMISSGPDVDMAFRKLSSEDYAERMDQIFEEDLSHMKDVLRQCGFAVKAPGGDYEQPWKWNMENYVSDPDSSTPEDFGA